MISEKAEAQVAVYFQTTPAARKFDSPANRKAVATRVTSIGSVPCEVLVMRCLNELVAEGVISRTDGGNEEKDRQATAAAEQRLFEQLAAAPSTQEECERFMRMSESEVESKYWSDKLFRARYYKASQTFGLRLPIRAGLGQAV